MSTFTKNKGLEKPISIERYNIDIVNKNNDIIDSELHKLELKNESQDKLLATKEELNSEISRSTTKENSIENTLNSEISRFVKKEAELAEKIKDETDRATAQEGIIDSKFSTEAATIRTLIDTAYASANGYTDTKIAELINGAPSTLDTLGEIANAMSDNQDVVAALNTAIGTKANQVEMESLFGTIDESLDNINLTLVNHSEDISDIQTKDTQQDEAIADLDKDIAGAQSQIVGLTTNAGKLQDKVGVLESDVSTLQTSSATHDSAISNINTDITLLKNHDYDFQMGAITLTVSVGAGSAGSYYRYAGGGITVTPPPQLTTGWNYYVSPTPYDIEVTAMLLATTSASASVPLFVRCVLRISSTGSIIICDGGWYRPYATIDSGTAKVTVPVLLHRKR